MEIELNYYFLRLNFNQWKAKIKIELKESLVLDDMNKFCNVSVLYMLEKRTGDNNIDNGNDV